MAQKWGLRSFLCMIRLLYVLIIHLSFKIGMNHSGYPSFISGGFASCIQLFLPIVEIRGHYNRFKLLNSGLPWGRMDVQSQVLVLNHRLIKDKMMFHDAAWCYYFWTRHCQPLIAVTNCINLEHQRCKRSLGLKIPLTQLLFYPQVNAGISYKSVYNFTIGLSTN